MPFERVYRRWFGRQIVAVLTLGAVVLGTFGVPIPRLISKEASQPFPCQHRACGCMNAAACWKSCCCTTPKERLAWAKRHGVQPPESLVAAVATASSPAPKACCAKEAASKACCETKPAPAPRVGWLVIDDARRCQGLVELYQMLSVGVPPIAPLDFTFAPLETGVLPIASLSIETFCSDVESPPPRLLA